MSKKKNEKKLLDFVETEDLEAAHIVANEYEAKNPGGIYTVEVIKE